MKKLFAVLIIICICLTVTACGKNGSEPTVAPDTTAAPETTGPVTQEPTIPADAVSFPETTVVNDPQKIDNISNYGEHIIYAKDFSELIIPELSCMGKAINPALFPIYNYKYPRGQGDGLFEMTEEIKSKIVENFNAAAGISGLDLNGEDYALEENYAIDDACAGIYACADGFSLAFECGKLTVNSTTDEVRALLKTDKVLKGAYDYSGISDDVIVAKTVEYNSDKSILATKFCILPRHGDVASVSVGSAFSQITLSVFSFPSDEKNAIINVLKDAKQKSA